MSRAATAAIDPSNDYTSFNVDLRRHLVSLPHESSYVSPGWIPASRLAASSDNFYYVASSAMLYRISVEGVERGVKRDWNDEVAGQQVFADDYVAPKGASETDKVKVEAVKGHCGHREEIQAICIDSDGRIVTVDAYGAAIVSDGVHGPYSIQSPTYEYGESGWAGATTVGSDVAVARYFFKDVSLFDGVMQKRIFHCRDYPTAIHGMSRRSEVLVTEGNELVLYDARVGESAGQCMRHRPGRGKLYALDVDASRNTIGVAGADRTVHVFDCRRWGAILGRWPACLKYECVGLRLSRKYPGHVYAAGIDNEVSGGAWATEAAAKIRPSPIAKMMSGANTRSSKRAFGFRADSRAVGIALRLGMSEATERLCVFSENAALYLMSVSSY